MVGRMFYANAYETEISLCGIRSSSYPTHSGFAFDHSVDKLCLLPPDKKHRFILRRGGTGCQEKKTCKSDEFRLPKTDLLPLPAALLIVKGRQADFMRKNRGNGDIISAIRFFDISAYGLLYP
jgi:hypothetical protein